MRVKLTHLQKAGARLFITGAYSEEKVIEWCEDATMWQANRDEVLAGYRAAKKVQARSLWDVKEL
jgi:hypothetical protein